MPLRGAGRGGRARSLASEVALVLAPALLVSAAGFATAMFGGRSRTFERADEIAPAFLGCAALVLAVHALASGVRMWVRVLALAAVSGYLVAIVLDLLGVATLQVS